MHNNFLCLKVANSRTKYLHSKKKGGYEKVYHNLYNNSKYGYSLNYPDTYNIIVVSDEYVEIGSKITVEVMTVDPTAPRGDDGSIPGTKCFLHDIKKTR